MDEFVRRPRRSVLQTETVPQIMGAMAVQPTPVEPADPPLEDVPTPKQSKNKKPKFKLPVPKTKKQWIIFGVIAALIIGLTGFAVYWFILRDTTPPVTYVAPEPEPEPLPEPIYSIVSGRELTDKAINDRPIYAVQIENSPEARPQSGLIDADIVSEAVAEGGITRFNVVFHDNIPANIGPVRSLRPYYIDWFLPYDAAIVHAGGSPQALSDVKVMGLKDMDSVPSIMRRISSRYSPHNYYTTGQQVLDLANSRGYKPNVASPLPRKVAETSAVPNASTVNLNISSALYNVSFVWDATTGTYMRNQGGSPHVDAETGKQITPSVVVVPVLNKGKNGQYTTYGTTGSGEVFVFQDGMVTRGTWTKPNRESQWQLKDTAGADIKLNPGQTWFTMIDQAGSVTFQ